MKLPKLAIENYQFVLVVVMLAVSLGLLSFFSMPRSEDPVLEIPIYRIVAVYPGTSPEDLEELVVDKIEEAVNEVEDIVEIQTEIEEGLVVFRIESEYGIDIDDKFDEINAKVNSVRGELPEELLSLEVVEVSAFDVNLIQLALTAPSINGQRTSYHVMQEWAEELEDKLEKVMGVRSVEIEGYPEEEVRIALDFEKLAQYQIPLSQVMGIIQANNANIPGGDIKAGARSFSLKTSGGYRSIEELENSVISARGGGILYLKDLAEISRAYEDDKYLARYNGDKAVFISVTQKEGFNVLEIDAALEEVINEFRETLPLGLEVHRAFEQAPAVEARINDFFANLLQGIALVGIIIFIFLGFRNALIIMTVIPTSIIIAINILDINDFGLQQISIAGLVIALGLLVDNGIVVVENINRLLREGKSLQEAAISGASEVGWAIVSSTATTMLAFFPMTQLGGGTGEYLKSLPLIVIYALGASLVLALAFTPLLAGKFLRTRTEKQRSRVEDALQRIIEVLYRPVLRFSLKRPWIVLALALIFTGATFTLFPLVGVSFFPTADKPVILVDIDTPEGTSLKKTNEVAEYVEQVIQSQTGIKSFVANVGHGNPQIYYNIFPENYKKNHAQVLVNLDSWTSQSFYALIDTFRNNFTSYPGAQISVVELKNGPPYEAPIAIKVIGDNLDTLKYYATQLENLIKDTPGTQNVDNPLAISKTDLKAQIQRDKAGMIGLQLADIDVAIRTAMNGSEVGTMNTDEGEEYAMVMRMPFDDQLSISDFSKIYLPSVTGIQVPLRQVAKLVFESSPAKIDHFDLQRTATVTSDVDANFNSRELTEQIIGKLDEIQLPQGYEFYIGGEYETQQESFGDLGMMLIVAILGIFAVLILQFRSFQQPFIVLSAIPLAFSGSILALFLSGFSFSFFAFVGFTSLVGIVVNTSIILVDYSNQLIDQGMPRTEAIQQASETRFVPIVLTTMTTILGLLPLTLTNSNLWSPLGWTIIGGMISSTMLTLLIVPLLYQWFTRREAVV